MKKRFIDNLIPCAKSNRFLFSILLLLSCYYSTSNNKFDNIIPSSLKLGFKENKGQIADVYGKPAPYVFYKAEAPGINIWVTNTGLTYQFIKVTELESNKSSYDFFEKSERIEYAWHRVDMIFKNATIRKENIIAENVLSQGKSDYYYAHCSKGVFAVKTFSKIIIKDIYRGIDWVLYTDEKQNCLKQDFIVQPYADPNQLKLIYEGSGIFEVLNNQIHFENEVGELQEGKLFCYQDNEKNEVRSNYIVKKNENITNSGAGNFLKYQDRSSKAIEASTSGIPHPSFDLFSYEVSIQLNNYDKSKNLTIDPQLTWGTFFGGSTAHEGAQAIADDPITGAITIVGYLGSTDFPVLNSGAGFFQGANGGANDAYVIHFSNTGVQQWATYIGGSGGEEAICVTSDQTGNIFVTGFTSSSNFPIINLPGAYNQALYGGIEDAFILKFNVSGNLLWSTYYGGSASDKGRGITTDAAGNVYITGETGSSNFNIFNLGGAFNQPIYGGGMSNAFVVKTTNNGVVLWSTFLGGNSREFGVSITVDNSGNIFIVGLAMSSNFPLVNPGLGAYYQPVVGGGRGAFITKFNNAGVMTWSTFFGGNAADMLMCVKHDAFNNIFIVGEATSLNITTANPGLGAYFQPNHGGGTKDAILFKFSNVGVMLWGTYYGGNGDETSMYGDNINFDDCNNVIIGLETTSSNTPLKTSCDNGFNDASLSGMQDQFITKFTNNAVQLWGTYVGGDGLDFGSVVTVDKDDNIYMAGEWSAGGSPINSSTYPTMNPGNSAYFNNTFAGGIDDSYVVKFAPSLPIAATATSVNAGCTGNGSATGNATGGCSPYQYLWYNASWSQIGNTQTINNLSAGTYHVIIKDSLSCSNPDTATVTIISSGGGAVPVITSGPSLQLNCTITSGVIFVASNPATVNYSWSGPGVVLGNTNDTAIVNAPGTYTVIVTDINNGCTSSSTIIVTSDTAKPNIGSPVPTTIGCIFSNSPISIGSSTSGVNYLWTGPGIVSGNTNNTAMVNTPGTYTVVITNPLNGCTNTATVSVSSTPPPTAGVSPNVTIALGANTTLTATGGGTYSWYSSVGLNATTGNVVVASPQQTTTYCVEVTDNNGCKDTACVTVFIDLPCPQNENLSVPNAFSPNGDGVNDEFCLQGWIPCNESFILQIYDRWGEKLYESKDPNFCWDGTFNKITLDSQVFVYYIRGKFIGFDDPIIKKGNISLIK